MIIIKNIILWSGGGDSTYLIYKLTTENPKELYHVVFYENPIFVNYNNYIKIKLQNILKKFNNMGIDNIIFQENKLYFNVEKIKYPTLYPTIPLSYHFDLIQYFDQETKVYQGFIKEDAEFHNKYLFFNLYDLFSKFLNLKLNIEFPLEYISKINIIENLIKLNLHKDVTYCVNIDEKGNSCNKCRNCLMQEMAIGGLYVKNYNKSLLDIIPKEYDIKW